MNRFDTVSNRFWYDPARFASFMNPIYMQAKISYSLMILFLSITDMITVPVMSS
ncbi:hypothetical protein [Faecalitalea cylindroides]